MCSLRNAFIAEAPWGEVFDPVLIRFIAILIKNVLGALKLSDPDFAVVHETFPTEMQLLPLPREVP